MPNSPGGWGIPLEQNGYGAVAGLAMLAIPAVGVLPAPVATEEHCPGRGEGLGHHPLRRLREVVAVDLLEHPPGALHVLHRMNIHHLKVMFDLACFYCLGNRSKNQYTQYDL